MAMDNDLIQKPSLAFFLGFITAVAYIPGTVGAAIPTGWLFLIITMPIVLLFCDFKFNISVFIGCLFVAFSALTLLWATSLPAGIFILLQMMALSCVFCFGENLKSLDNVFKGLAAGLGVSSVIACFQYAGYKGVYTIGADIVGLFVNPNIYSEISALMLVALIILELYWWIPVTLPGLLLIQSRTAFVGLGIGLFIWLFLKNKKLAILVPLGIGMLTFLFFGNSFKFSSIHERVFLWQDTLRGLSVFGSGVGSYETTYPLYATHIDTTVARPKFAHNDLLQVIFEIGIFSVFLMALIVRVLSFKDKHVIILMTLGAMSLLTYPMHVPMEAFIGCLVAGFIVGHNDPTWNIGDSCRSIVPLWFKNRGFSVCKIS